MNKLTHWIIQNNISSFFVSPHLDDAALSAGFFMKQLSDAKMNVTVINIFTNVHNTNQTLSAKKFLRQTGYLTPQKLVSDRIQEDKEALKEVTKSVINLNFTDALWRTFTPKNFLLRNLSNIIPELQHVYPIYRLHIESGFISHRDDELTTQVSHAINTIVSSSARHVIFCPLGIGGHVDHVLTRTAVEKISQPYYWSDQPYAYRLQRFFIPDQINLVSHPIPVDFIWKRKLLQKYKTQIDALFPHGDIANLDETIYELQ